jgi:mono/diheme cytochrome c family protein
MRRFVWTLAVVAALVAVARLVARGGPGDVPIVSMDPHMVLTALQPVRPGDKARAAAVVTTVKRVMAQYQDYHAAEAAGFQEMNPNLRLPQKHFTNWAYAREAWFGRFNPEHPTSLLYQTVPGGFKLVGAMYTASTGASKEELNRDAPLSIAQWHRHVNLCVGPPGTPLPDYLPPNARFGFAGSIATRSACQAAGGRFVPQIYGWMVHVWPYQSDPKKVWAHDMNGGEFGSMQSMRSMEQHHLGATVTYTSLPIELAKLPVADVAPGDASAGAKVFAANCAVCHGTGGRDGPDAPALADKGIAAGQVAYMVRHPQGVDRHSAMPQLPLTDRELADVAAYVAALK